MKTFMKMFKIEFRLSLRGIDMFIFAICMPVVVMLIIGMIYGNKSIDGNEGYTMLDQAFPAISTIAVCAGGVMGLPLVVSDYRNKRILKRFKVTPVKPSMILAVQVGIYTVYAFVSLILVHLTASLFFQFRFKGNYLYFTGAYLLTLISMLSLGMMVGGISSNVKTAGVLASVLYFPMLIFSGATLPYEIMPEGLQKIVNVLPLTQGIKLLKAVSLNQSVDSIVTPVVVMLVVSAICIFISIRFFRWNS